MISKFLWVGVQTESSTHRAETPHQGGCRLQSPLTPRGHFQIIQAESAFLAVVMLRSLFLRWLSAGGGSQLPEATLESLTPGPLAMTAKFCRASRRIPP